MLAVGKKLILYLTDYAGSLNTTIMMAGLFRNGVDNNNKHHVANLATESVIRSGFIFDEILNSSNAGVMLLEEVLNTPKKKKRFANSSNLC